MPDKDLERVKQELVVHFDLTRQESGCLVFEVTPDANDPNRFNVYEEFVDQHAFDHHQARIANSNWGKVTKRVSRHYQITTRES